MKIFKYPIEIVDRQVLNLPSHAEILHVGLDPTCTPCIWCRVEPTARPVPTTILVHGTGHDVSPVAKHIGSFVTERFVWHVFTN